MQKQVTNMTESKEQYMEDVEGRNDITYFLNNKRKKSKTCLNYFTQYEFELN